jgi:hypothetical protein
VAHPGRGLLGCSLPKLPKTEFKNIYFADIMNAKALLDLPFSQNQTLRLADD